MRRHKNRTWAWFATAAALGILAIFAPGPTLTGIASLAALLAFAAACIHSLGQLVSGDSERLHRVVREEGLMGLMAVESARGRRRRRSRGTTEPRSRQGGAPPPGA